MSRPEVSTAALQSRLGRPRLPALGTLAVLAALVLPSAVTPPPAQAHGPVAPVASSYLARVERVPGGIRVKVIDGDQRLWLQAPAPLTVVVLDYRGAPYLRFSPAGIEVNQNSEMYYLNQTPVAQTPPSGLSVTTPPSWQRISRGHATSWHDGRLHALAAVALRPGASYVGAWTIPIVIGGARAAVSGGLWHAPNPSIVWLWPIVVLLACVLAAWRIREPSVDSRIARLLAGAALLAITSAALGRGLHGRPSLSPLQLLELAATLVFAGWAALRLARPRPGYFVFFVIAFAALWEGAELISTLFRGFVLIPLPSFLARATDVLCLGCGGGLLMLVFRLAEQRPARSSRGPGRAADGPHAEGPAPAPVARSAVG